MPYESTFESVIDKLLTKFPHVTNFSWECDTYTSLSTNSLQNMKKLKKVIVVGDFLKINFMNFSSLLPHDLESLEIKCYLFTIEEIEKIRRIFYGKFPFATLILTV